MGRVHSGLPGSIPTAQAVNDPFLIEGPTLWSTSGGRTSANMLWRAIQTHGGTLPADHVVAFANTGRERPETLKFVHDLASRWGVHIVWVEWRPTHAQAERISALREKGFASQAIAEWATVNADDAGFAVVGPNSASRNGEPFEALVAWKERLPNGQERWCTTFLKVLPLHALMRSLGRGEPGDYAEPIGIRADEVDRIGDGMEASEKDGRRRLYPLAKAGITKRDVRDFWFGKGRRYETSERPRGFDLELTDLWGNCDLCFQMGVRKREERVRRDPSVAPWWRGCETRIGGRFSKNETVADLEDRARAHKATPDLLDDADDEECGLSCPRKIAA